MMFENKWLYPESLFFLVPFSSNSAVRRWTKKFEERLTILTEKKRRNLIAIDETVVKANREKYYIYTAIECKN